MNYVIASTEDNIRTILGVWREPESFAVRFPHHMQAKESFMAWVKEKEGFARTEMGKRKTFEASNFKASLIVKKVM